LTSGTPEALALLWYAGPLGRAAASLDLSSELRILAGWNAALTKELATVREQLHAALLTLHHGTANEPIFSDSPQLRKSWSSGRDDRPGAIAFASCTKVRQRSALA
jgi:hypothetical protein